MAVTVIDLLIRMRRHFAGGLNHKNPETAAETRQVLALLPRFETLEEPVIPAPATPPGLRPALQAFFATHSDVLGGGWDGLALALPWRYAWAVRADDPDLDRRMGWYEFVGPEAPIRCTDVCFGLMYLAAHTHYRPHSHPAAEIYNAVAGSASFSSGERQGLLSPGGMVFNRPDVIHELSTVDEPLLLVYSWTGDLLSNARWVEEPQGRA
ncbi:MAG: AraC family ligand binding domain-containing protein [Methylobacteriaceae bacterium]|jgi:mannose-6-phosphate isomerase-like protein (cupin superfamily)|nr:AraC family ligand binding domain-containing protein [Methylobacteriaceae bacterium]